MNKHKYLKQDFRGEMYRGEETSFLPSLHARQSASCSLSSKLKTTNPTTDANIKMSNGHAGTDLEILFRKVMLLQLPWFKLVGHSREHSLPSFGI